MNLTLATGLEDQYLPDNIGSDVNPAVSSGVNYDDSTYLELRENLPAIKNTTPDIPAIIEETGKIFEVFSEGLEELNTPGVIFTQDNKIEPTDIVE